MTADLEAMAKEQINDVLALAEEIEIALEGALEPKLAALAERLAIVERERDDLRALCHASIGECCDTWNVARVHHVDCPMMALNTRQIAEQSRDRACAERDALAAEVERWRKMFGIEEPLTDEGLAAMLEGDVGSVNRGVMDGAVVCHAGHWWIDGVEFHASRKEAHDLRGQLQKLTLKLDLAEAKQAAAEGERDRLIAEVRAEASRWLDKVQRNSPCRDLISLAMGYFEGIADRAGKVNPE